MTNQEPRFDQRATLAALDRNVTSIPRLDAGYFRRLLDYGRQTHWGCDIGSPALNDMTNDAVREYFEIFLAERVNQHLLPDLRQLTASFSIAINDHPGHAWLLDIRNGVLRSISRDGAATACSFALDSTTFLEIASGQLPPQRAFFAGRTRITGNIELGLKVASVLTKFFAEYPFVAASV
jgi:predicted lipid carrier protein YhbT